MEQTLGKASRQLDLLNALLRTVWATNAFYRHRWRKLGLEPCRITSLNDFSQYPTIRKADFRLDQVSHPPFGGNFTLEASKFVRLHRSSGTSGSPIHWLDDEASWQALVRCSESAFRMAGITSSDRLFLSARFGASLGPWILRDGACNLGCLCIAPGEMAIHQELQLLRDLRPTVLVGKPGKLLLLAKAAVEAGTQPQNIGLEKIITVSEPGGSNPSIRGQLESDWAAECFDRYGLTEAGTVASECVGHSGGLHILEEEILAEVLHIHNDARMPDGAEGELVLTHLGRIGQPIVRYRTGDLVRMRRHSSCRCGLSHSLLVMSIARLAGNLSPVPGLTSP